MPSSVIAAMDYDSASEILRISFVSGMIYEYRNVPEKIYKRMKGATSKGIFFNRNIRGKYPFEKTGNS